MNLGLQDRIVVVTGGTRNIGAATVRAFAAEGARVAFTYAADQDRAAAMVTELGGPDRAVAIRYDLADPASVEALVPAVEARWGGVDVLVANAVRRPALRAVPTFDGVDPAEWSAFLRENLTATLRTVQLAVASMRARGGGRIVLVSSHVATRGHAGQEVYAAAKAALHGFANSLARDAGRDGVLVNVVSPGLTTTPDALAFMPPDVLEQQAALMPTGRLGDPGDVARVIVFYSSSANQNISAELVSMVGRG